MFDFLRRKTTEEKMIDLKCKIAGMERELEVLWKIETTGNYITGKRDEIISLEKKLAYKKKDLN